MEPDRSLSATVRPRARGRDTFSYSCTYQNPGALPITFGETAAYNEMCIAIGYYFPVDATGQTDCF